MPVTILVYLGTYLGHRLPRLYNSVIFHGTPIYVLLTYLLRYNLKRISSVCASLVAKILILHFVKTLNVKYAVFVSFCLDLDMT